MYLNQYIFSAKNNIDKSVSPRKKVIKMSQDLLIPLQVMGLGIVISYGIAGMMKLILFCIRAMQKHPAKEASHDENN